MAPVLFRILLLPAIQEQVWCSSIAVDVGLLVKLLPFNLLNLRDLASANRLATVSTIQLILWGDERLPEGDEVRPRT